jgi:hypothetical protein
VRKDVASIVISLNPLQNFHSTSTTLLRKSTVELPPQLTLRGPVSHATCAKDRISPVSIQNREVLTRLYHPRTDQWTDHFEWHGVTLVGKTAVGRTTVEVLAINDADSVAVREALRDEGIFES